MGRMPMKQPSITEDAILALLSGEWIIFLSMNDLTLVQVSFLKNEAGHLQKKQMATSMVFRMLILAKSRKGLKCDTLSGG